MKIAEKLWKKTKLTGKEVDQAQVETKIVEQTNLQPQELAEKPVNQSQDLIKKALTEKKVGVILHLFEKLCIPCTEIEKLSDAEIDTIFNGLKNTEKKNWGYNEDENFMLEKQKVATWGEYDLYLGKVARTQYKVYLSSENCNRLLLENYVFVTEKDGRILGVMFIDNNNFDIKECEAILPAFGDLWYYEKENINNICFKNLYSKLENAWLKVLSKNGKTLELCLAGSKSSLKHYTIPSHILKKDDKIIKNSLENISRDYEILPNGEMRPLNNWQLMDEEEIVKGELLGLKKQNGQNVVDKSEYCTEKFKAEFDSNKNYGDISLYAQQNESGEFEIQANDDDRDGEWTWKKVAVSPRFNQPVLQMTVFDNVRKQEIINSNAEVEEVHFFDANNFELAGNFKFDKTQTKFESERDYTCGGGHWTY